MMCALVMAFAVTGITANATPVLNSSVIKDYKQVSKFKPNIYTQDFGVGQTSATATINVPSKGTVILFAAANTTATMNINSSSGYGLYLSNNGKIRHKEYDFSSKGTYTITMSRTSYAANTSGRIAYFAVFINSGSASIKENQVTAYYSQDYSNYSYTKIKISKTGYIKVQTPSSEGYGVYVTLCNSKKKAVSEENFTSEKSGVASYFAVSKGTYYIKTKTTDGNIYNVKYSFKMVKEKSGSKKFKAVTIKPGKTVKGVLTANGKNQTDWYKIKLTKRKAVKFTVKSYNTYNDIKIQFIPASKVVRILNDTSRLYGDGKSYTLKSDGEWYPCTYYIKVTKSKKSTSGYYQIKFNK